MSGRARKVCLDANLLGVPHCVFLCFGLLGKWAGIALCVLCVFGR